MVASAKGEMCGVADYTERLAEALQRAGAEARVEFLDQWSWSEFLTVRRKYGRERRTVFHMQYPSLHLGRSISPGFLPLLLPNTFVTLHEFRLFNLLRKLIFLPTALLSRRIIFSNQDEMTLFRSYFPLAARRLAVLPIGNNIARTSTRAGKPAVERLVYFGQISRNKGIEFFLDTVARLRAAAVPVEAEIIGALVEPDATFVDMVKASAERHAIRLRLNMPPEDVSTALSEATLALLPFPDGVSNKRGSALACLDHGVSVLTTHSKLTPQWLSVVTHPVQAPDDAAATITRIAHNDVERILSPEILARELRARDWSEIAKAHLKIYETAT